MKRADMIKELRYLIDPERVIDSPEGLEEYRTDWYKTHAGNPDGVVQATSTADVASAVRVAHQADMPVVPRGAGTGLAGGARPIRGGLVVSTTRMQDIQAVDTANRRAQVQPGIINYEFTQSLLQQGYYFAPDPASWKICTIGGNIANNSGGPHCLKYGVTTNHILAVEMVLSDGRTIWSSDGLQDAAGYDLTGLVVGSEGTLGFVTSALVRITRASEATRVAMALFPDMISSSEAVSRIVAAGLIPTSLEVMDQITIRAVNAAYDYGMPDQSGSALIMEVDGVLDGLDDALEEMVAICRQCGALDIRLAYTAPEQEHLWAARKSAFEALRKVYPDYYLVDTVVPRTRLPAVIEQIGEIGKQYNMPIANVFHAGDGNLHPLVLYDPTNEDEVKRTHAIIGEVMRLSIAEGGAITGEHGIGVDKQMFMPLLFGDSEFEAMAEVYAIFNPHHRFNPGKVFPAEIDPLRLAEQRQQRLAATQGIRSDDAEWQRTLHESLATCVGHDHVQTGNETDASMIQGHTPHFVVHPANQEQLAAVLAASHRAGARVVPWGGGTQQGMGYLASAPDVVVSTRRMHRVLNYRPEDLTISIEAGMTLTELQTLLAEHGQMFPLEVPNAAQATIGGLVATATESPRRTRYGTLRDLVIGMTVIEVDGTVSRFGGQVVKNVSGYDMVKLFHGSHGTLGILASVNLRILPHPPAENSLLLSFAERAQAFALLTELAMTHLTPTALEYLDHTAMHTLTQDDSHCGVLLRIEGTDTACQRHVQDIQALANKHSATATRLFTAEEHAPVWQQVNDLLAPQQLEQDDIMLRLVVLPAQTEEAIAHMEALAGNHALSLRCQARAWHGVIYARVGGAAESIHQFCASLTERWHHCHVLACDPQQHASLPRWGKPDPNSDLMAAIKQAFDPAHTLNRGRMDGCFDGVETDEREPATVQTHEEAEPVGV